MLGSIIKHKLIKDGKLIEGEREVTEIGRSAFYGCESLTEVTPKGVTRIGEKAFYGYTNLSEVTIPLEEVTSLTEVTIHEGVAEIGDSAFEGKNAFFGNYDKIRYYTD